MIVTIQTPKAPSVCFTDRGCKKTVSEEHLTRRAALSGVLSRERGAKERTKEGKRKVLEQKE